jgi:hypothetical protein
MSPIKPGELNVLLRHLDDERWTAKAVGGVCLIKRNQKKVTTERRIDPHPAPR